MMSNGSIEEKVKILQEKMERTSTGTNRMDSPFQNQGVVGIGTPRLGSGRRPKPPPMFSTREIPAFPPKTPHAIEQERRFKEVCKVSGKLNVGGVEYRSDIDDLQHLGELGSGTCGQVIKMLHKPSGAIIAVKQMRRSSNLEETKRILMDLDIVVRSHDCPYIVRCFGCFVTEADVWICMELMASCFDKLLRRLGAPMPEEILGKVTVATVKALSYLKDVHGVIHRDVKPSNILLDERGNVKLCDFGISGRLVDSKAKTRGAGCAAYMAPERIEPPDPKKPVYDIRADVWSLGISLVELATGVLPYKDCQNDFEVLTRVLKEDPPRLPEDSSFTPEFRSFVSQCLTKDVEKRPKYTQLLEHPFVTLSARSRVSVADWYSTLAWGAEHGPAWSPEHGPAWSPEHGPARVVTTVATHNVGGGSNGGDNYVTSAQHWIDQVTPQPQRACWGMNAHVASGSSSQPASLEAEPTSLSPMMPRRRTIEECVSPPRPPARHSPAEHRWRTASPSPSSTSPILLQRFYHQKQQRRSRSDAPQPRHRSLTREPAAGSPPPPPRTARHHNHHHFEANGMHGSAELERPPLHERLHAHPPSPLLLTNRFAEGRSQSLTRAEPRGSVCRFEPAPPAHPAHLAHPSPPAPPAPPRQRLDEPSWLHSLAGLLKRRLSGYVKGQHVAGAPPPRSRQNRWAPAESWSMPASPLPPRAPAPRPSD